MLAQAKTARTTAKLRRTDGVVGPPRSVGIAVLLGTVVYVGAAIGVELIEWQLAGRYVAGDVARGVQEVGEMSGAAIILLALRRVGAVTSVG